MSIEVAKRSEIMPSLQPAGQEGGASEATWDGALTAACRALAEAPGAIDTIRVEGTLDTEGASPGGLARLIEHAGTIAHARGLRARTCYDLGTRRMEVKLEAARTAPPSGPQACRN